MIVPFLVVLTLAATASQPPSPSGRVGSQTPQQQSATQNKQPSNQNPPVTALVSQQPAQQPNQATAPQNQQPTPNRWDRFVDNGANWAIVFLTFVLAVIGYFQWLATDTANRHNTVTERAYVTMSHRSFSIDDAATARVRVLTRIKISNTGNTPAKITAIQILSRVTEFLPTIPPYQQAATAERVEAFVSANDWFNLSPRLDLLSTEQWAAVQLNRTERLWLIGYIDYIDKFGNRHRSGYARVYDPDAFTLVLVQTPGYNYDRPREKGEGNDWDEPTKQS